jgi:YVTN family beta-propeller protein
VAEFVVLGPLEVIEDGRPLPLGGPKQRALLAILLLHANRSVSRDRLIDGIWGEQPPDNPAQALDTYVSRLRKALGADRIERRPGGFAVRVEADELDLERFERLAAAGSYAEALAVWRGPALDDLLYEPFAQHEAERLEERRLDVLEDRIEADLAAGAGGELVPELEQRVREHPLRERLLGQLMLALYRGGRQTAALETYRRARRSLADELGLEPGPHLQELERRILAHDSALGARPRAIRRGRRRWWALAAVVVAAGAAATVVTLSRSGSADLASTGLVAISSPAGDLQSSASLAAAPAAMVAAGGSLWIADPAEQAVLRSDSRTGDVSDRIPFPAEPGPVAAGGGAIWVAGTLSGVVARIDPASGTVTQTIHLGHAYTSAIAYGARALWVADSTDQALIELDPVSGVARRTFELPSHPTALAVGSHAVWVADHDGGVVLEIDVATGQTLAEIHVGNGPAALALGAGGLWVANSLDSTVSRIDPSTASVVATVPVGSWPAALAVSAGLVWVANQYGRTVSRIDPRRNAVVGSSTVGGSPVALASDGTRVWVGTAPAASAHRGGTLVLASSSQPSTVDPGRYSQAPVPAFTGLAYDSLVRFAQVSGPGGLSLVPDLAVNVPTPSSGGTTYRFRLRAGIRYSDGRPLRAGDFRRAFERLFRLRSPGADDFASLVGASACRRRPSSCSLVQGVVTDDRAGTVVFRLSRPDGNFLFNLTDFAFSAPLPPGVPGHDSGFRPLPGTGPYRIVSAGRQSVRFERNSYFREWSHAAQPDGNPDAIVWRFSRSHAQTIHWVRAGIADWTWDLISSRELAEIRRTSPSQLHANAIFAIEFLPLNTNLPPFNDVRVRRALNYAVDRGRIARMYGGAFVALPACQPLVPGFLGYRRYCPYDAAPDGSGAYHGPDLAKARRLVAESGTRGQRVDVWGASDEFVVPVEETAYIGNVLRSLGYRVRVHLKRLASITPAERRRWQISTDGDWLPAYPEPSSYLVPFFSCGGALSNGYNCNRSVDARMKRASALQLSDPRQAGALWQAVDHELTDLAYWVPTVADRAVELTSRRVRNYQFQPAFGSMIVDQVWLR